jgi:hypothetical protein
MTAQIFTFGAGLQMGFATIRSGGAMMGGVWAE